MRALYLVVGREGFRQVVRTCGLLEGRPLGGLAAGYARARLALAPDEWVVVVPAPAGGRLDDLEERLNRPNRAGKVFLREALRSAFPESPAVLLHDRRAKPRRPADTDRRFVQAYVRELSGAVSGALHVSLEAGHIHSDRTMGAVQRRGLEIGRLLRDELLDRCAGRADELALELTPMVDDNHVVNRMAYAEYRRLTAAHGLPADDLILESSPVVGAIAIDILKRVLARDGERFVVEHLGDNVYLVSDGLRVELAQSARTDLRIGCVLFDTALGVYRTDRGAFSRLFFEQRGLRPYDLHRAMTEAYDAHPRPDDRDVIRSTFEALWRPTWPELQAQLGSTPYLDLYEAIAGARAKTGDRTVILNVLESYYEPLERKVLRLAELIDLEMPLEAVLFAPYGVGLWTIRAGRDRVRGR